LARNGVLGKDEFLGDSKVTGDCFKTIPFPHANFSNFFEILRGGEENKRNALSQASNNSGEKRD
jgi:hypothetical protein